MLTRSRPTSPVKLKVFALITLILSASVVLIAGELLVRMLLPFWPLNSPDWVRTHSLQYLGSVFSRHRLKPLQVIDAETSNPSPDENPGVAGHRYFINGMGYRGPEIAPRKRPSVQRIIILGGSSVFDQNMTDSTAAQGRDWPHRVERLLNEEGFQNVEIINAGVPGHASFDALGRLYAQLWMYKPDYILFYEAWNDIKYFRDLSPERPLIVRYEPFKPGSNVFAEYQGWWDRLLSGSQLYVKLRNRYYEWKARGWSSRIGREGVAPEGPYQSTLSGFAIDQYRLDVKLIVDLARDIGAIPILITQATLVSPRNSEKERRLISYEYQLLTHSALVQAFAATYQVLRAVGSEKSVPVLDLAKDLNGRAEFFTDHVHLNAKGSEEVARRVAEFLAPFLRTEPRDGNDGPIRSSRVTGTGHPGLNDEPDAS